MPQVKTECVEGFCPGALDCEKPNVIGCLASFFHNDTLLIGTVLDMASGTNQPKRIRIQRGPLQGKVVQPFEYQFKSFLKSEDIDE